MQLRGNYEEACQHYEEAAKMNDLSSMLCLAKLYLSGQFRKVYTAELTELMFQGNPRLPWNYSDGKWPDYERGLKWLTKAANLGDAIACETLGNMLGSGIGCEVDTDRGLQYLETAIAKGRKFAKNYIYLYCPDGKRLTDEEYESCLLRFEKAVKAGDDVAYKLYATLKSGTWKQLARLGYVLTVAQTARKAGYEPFQYSVSPSGKLLIPVAVDHLGGNFLRFNLNAWKDRYPLIAVASDILDVDEPEWLLEGLHHARVVGWARYKTPGFGWMGEEKVGVVIRLGEADALEPAAMTEVVRFYLTKGEYKSRFVAGMIENGEKEYSFEVASINGKKMDVLARYSVDVSNRVSEYIEPKLISLELDRE